MDRPGGRGARLSGRRGARWAGGPGARRAGGPRGVGVARARRPAARLLVAAFALVLASALVSLDVQAVAPCWRPPVDVPVAVPFRAPACTWCAGHRGLEYRPPPGTAVRAVADGVVTFAGSVAGVRYVVVRLPDGRRVTYGELAASDVVAGARVRVGRVLGRAGERLFLGVRQGNHHVDPAPLLCSTDVAGRVRLLPLRG